MATNGRCDLGHQFRLKQQLNLELCTAPEVGNAVFVRVSPPSEGSERLEDSLVQKTGEAADDLGDKDTDFMRC